MIVAALKKYINADKDYNLMRESGYSLILHENTLGFGLKIIGFSEKINLVYDKVLSDINLLVSSVDFKL